MLNIWKASTLVLAGALALVVGKNAVVNDVDAEPQPHMIKALDRLAEAKRSLESATPDKGGHRVKAIDAVNVAINEVKEGIKYDDEHKNDKDARADKAKDDAPNKPHTKRLENPK
jgi:hypothetical protein